MRLREDLEIKQIGDEYIIVTESDKGWDYTRIVSLNESAAYLIESSRDAEFSVEDWVALLEARYEVDRAQAETDANLFINKLTEGGFILA